MMERPKLKKEASEEGSHRGMPEEVTNKERAFRRRKGEEKEEDKDSNIVAA